MFYHCGTSSGVSRERQFASRKMISLTGIRFFIEFSSILVLAFLCIMHEFTDVTLAKQFNIDHASSNQASLDEVEQQAAASSLYNHLLSTDDEQSAVRFTPESLDFGHQPISMPVIETVYIHNRHDESNIQMISISGNTEHFHCSFFEDKVVPVQSNTSFQVVFLARQEGLVNNTLYIHSSVGSFQYRVSAFGEASPFRVRPLIGARVPLNSSFASLIYVYNPFATPLQLTEMYTSGGGLHLELPNDESEAPSNLWKVPPYETRPVMKAHFVARIASNHTSYIRIRTNATDFQLMLPVEVEVSNSPGLYSPLDTVDFGVLRAKHDQPKVMPIQVINAAMKSIHVQNIVVTPLSDGLTVEFDGPTKLSPRSSSPYHIANLVLDPARFSCTGLCSGKILIKSKNNQYKLSIPFIVRIIQGELYFNDSLSHFFVNQCSTYSEQRLLSVENRFDSPIIVHDITVPAEAKPYFKLTTEHPLPLVLPVGVSFPLLKLEFTPSPQLSHFSTAFRLLTNFSHFDLPLFAYRGRLDLFIPNSLDQTKLDIGLVGLSEKKSLTFVIANHNPIAIRLNYWHCNLTGILVELVGTSHGNVTAISQRIEPSGLSRSEITLLQPSHFAVFRVHVDKISKEGVYNGQIMIKTPFETLNVPLMLKVLRGSLSADKVILPKTFPGRMVTAYLNVKSNYTSQIKIKGAFIEPKDERFQIKLSDKLIKPGQDNKIAITFDATALCLQRLCYSALDVEKEVGHLWLLGTGLYSDTAYIDKELYKLLRNQWLLLGESDRNPAVNVRLQVDGFGSFTTEAQAQLHWPRLSNKLVIRFSSIRIGRTVTKDLVIENPADRSILVQAINVVDYPNSDVLLQLISNGIFHQQWPRGDIESIHAAIRNGQNTSAFYFVNSSTTSPPPPQASPSLNSNSNRINDWLGVEPNSNSYTMLLPPGARQRLTVAFQPQFEGNVTSLLILRNNLTIVEVVMLRGEGGRGLLKIGTAVPNSSTNSKLMFEFSERNLERKCRNAMQKVDFSKQQHLINSLIIKEKFKATNVGRMGLQIRHFLIDGMACEGYGFHINRCEPIFLLPNQTFEMEIVYSPDFTQPTVTHELRIIVDDDPMNSQTFKLVANVPQKLLQSCLAALPRPVWENFIYYLLLSMALLVLLLSIIVAISDAHRITFNYSMQLLKMEKSKSRAESNGCNGSMANSNGYDCPNNTNSTDSSYSKNKLIDSNGIVVNGNHSSNQNSNHQKQSSLTKVRNRKGSSNNNNNNNNHRNSNSNSINRNKNSQQQHSANTSNSRPEVTKSEELPQYNLSNSDQTSTQTATTASNWSYVLRKKLLRQDSSSSEQSQPSSDSNNSTSSLKNIGKDLDYSNRSKSMNGDIASIVPQQEQSISKIAQTDRKSKKEEKKSTEPTKNGKNKNSKSGKSQKPAQKLLEKTINQADSTKSSSESLNFSATTGTSKFDPMEVIPKVRSATLPLINDQKSSFNENMSISQSNILPNLYENNQRFVESIENQNGQMRMKGYNNGAQKQTGRNFERSDSAYGNRNRNVDLACYPRHQDSSRVSPPPGFAERNKDIWDHPITTFDSELAMSMLVKQTEEFAANGNEKLGSHHRFSNENHGRKFAGQSERNNNKMASRLNDDKWEIGEWSNDLAKHAASMMNNNKNNGSNKSMDDPKDHYYNYHNQHQQHQPQMDNRRPSFRDLDNRLSNNLSMNDYQQLRNQLQHSYKQNSSANFRNSATSSYGIVNPLPVGSSTAASGPSSISKNSSLSSNSPGFSPVIGRPTPPPTQQQQQTSSTSSLLSGQHVPSRFNSVHSKFSNEFSNFVTKNDSPPIDLPFNGPFGSAKTNLDLDLSFLEQNSLRYPNGPIASTGSSALIQPPTLISDNYHRPSLNTFLGEAPEWNRHPLDSFPISSSTFISSPDSLTKSSVSNIFSFENESVWTSTAASPSSSSLWSTPPITNAGSNSKSSKAFGFGIGSALDDKIINSSWPSASSLSNGNASSGLVQPSNHHQQFAPGSGQEYGKFAKTTQNSNNSRVWSPFDYYDYSSGSSNIDLTQRPISGTATLPPQPPPLSTSISNKNNNNPKILSDIAASSTPIGFENSSTVFGLFGSSPWSPLGTSPTETTTSPIISTPTPPLPTSSSPQLSALGEATAASDHSSNNNNNLTGLSPPISLESSQSIADPFNGRFSRNISPSPSSTSTNLSSDTATSGATNTSSSSRSSSSNQADCGETSEKSANLN